MCRTAVWIGWYARGRAFEEHACMSCARKNDSCGSPEIAGAASSAALHVQAGGIPTSFDVLVPPRALSVVAHPCKIALPLQWQRYRACTGIRRRGWVHSSTARRGPQNWRRPAPCSLGLCAHVSCDARTCMLQIATAVARAGMHARARAHMHARSLAHARAGNGTRTELPKRAERPCSRFWHAHAAPQSACALPLEWQEQDPLTTHLPRLCSHPVPS